MTELQQCMNLKRVGSCTFEGFDDMIIEVLVGINLSCHANMTKRLFHLRGVDGDGNWRVTLVWFYVGLFDSDFDAATRL